MHRCPPMAFLRERLRVGLGQLAAGRGVDQSFAVLPVGGGMAADGVPMISRVTSTASEDLFPATPQRRVDDRDVRL